MDFKKILTRAASGLVYCLIIVGCLLFGIPGTCALALLLSILACVEFSKMCGDMSRRAVPALILDIAGCAALVLAPCGMPVLAWVAAMVLRFIAELYLKEEQPLRSLAHSMLSQVYIGVPLAAMTYTAHGIGSNLILAVFLFLWINDTGAFLVGSSIGRHRLFERISPKKSWEGFFGGLIFCLIAALLFALYCSEFFGMEGVAAWLGLGATVSVFGTWGDLVESMMKRTLHVKDSGNMIPGHGGILDRIDSLLLAMPATAIYIGLLMMSTIL